MLHYCFLFSCSIQKSPYVKLVAVSSRDGKQCLTFATRYDKRGGLLDNTTYVLGFPAAALDSLPKDNFLSLQLYSYNGLVIKWGDTILIRDNPAMENKLKPSAQIDFREKLSEQELREFHQGGYGWLRYDFVPLNQRKYKSCNNAVNVN